MGVFHVFQIVQMAPNRADITYVSIINTKIVEKSNI